MDAVWVAWGSPDQKGFGRYHGKSTETWIYHAYSNDYYPYYGGFGYPYYGGFGGGGVLVGGRHGGRHFVGLYDPFYDPFFYPRFRQVSYPYKTVTFRNGRVVAFQHLHVHHATKNFACCWPGKYGPRLDGLQLFLAIRGGA